MTTTPMGGVSGQVLHLPAQEAGCRGDRCCRAWPALPTSHYLEHRHLQTAHRKVHPRIQCPRRHPPIAPRRAAVSATPPSWRPSRLRWRRCPRRWTSPPPCDRASRPRQHRLRTSPPRCASSPRSRARRARRRAPGRRVPSSRTTTTSRRPSASSAHGSLSAACQRPQGRPAAPMQRRRQRRGCWALRRCGTSGHWIGRTESRRRPRPHHRPPRRPPRPPPRRFRLPRQASLLR
mmetsp:Transcript_104181/g.271267  ORF Transcript_104181/g.271267 Transcript_104181/m.271267 type:complete len:234 (+) Transcript_104181:1134-1835(+)